MMRKFHTKFSEKNLAGSAGLINLGRFSEKLGGSIVRGVFRTQEGAVKGYNSKKKGQRSYHPLLCFVAESRECLHNWFRTGTAFSANGSVEFMKECFAKLPKRIWKVFVRADSAFFDGALLNLLESKSCQYLIKVNLRGLTTPIKTAPQYVIIKN